MKTAITILPESDDRTLCIVMSGIVTADVYNEFFMKPLEKIIARHGIFNLCAIYTDYEGWESDAAEISFKFYTKISRQIGRVSFINAPDSRHLLLKMLEPVMPNAQVKNFEPDQKDEAIAWAKNQSP